ncbi:hypothetical protein TWF173_008683 [Orbilia oligospora]|nr:hypothetical protein TWF173_008683 [Orbilia oligospora]
MSTKEHLSLDTSSSFLPTWFQKRSKSKERYEYNSESVIRWGFTKLWPNIHSFLIFLLPSFISNRYSKTPPRYSLKSTSWLDGLRGIACLLVYSYHFHGSCFPTMREPWDYKTNNGYIALPIIRILHSGDTMVAIFFIISGFALSIKSVKTLKGLTSFENGHALSKDLASSVCRRYLRLVLPCAGSFLMVGLFASAGWFEAVPYNRENETWLRGGMISPRAPMQESFYKQAIWVLGDYYKYAVDVVLFNDSIGYRWETNSHLWTIPMEFRESLYVFLMILGLSNFKRWARVRLVLPLCVIIGLYNGSWQFALFMLGFLLAEIHATLEDDENYLSLGTPNGTKKSVYDRHPRVFSFLKVTALTVGLYLGSYPIRAPLPHEASGFSLLTAWTPPSHVYTENHGPVYFWAGVGAGMIVASIVFLPVIQKLLCSGVCQYLGRISFSLYLVHGPLLQSLGYSLLLATWGVMGVGKLFDSERSPNDPTDKDVQNLENWKIVTTWFVFAINTTGVKCNVMHSEV